MSRYHTSVQVLEEFDDLVSEEWLSRIARFTLAAEHAEGDDSIDIVIADDAIARELNKRHRGLDENTDVLSFSFVHQGEYHGERDPPIDAGEEADFVLPPGVKRSLGEVIISCPQAQRQADTLGHPVEREIAVLLIHGILHLLGHDHEGLEEEATMKDVQDKVLSQVWSQT